MNDDQFMQFADVLAQYLEMKKIFVQNPQRMADVSAAYEMAHRLFPDAKMEIKDDPLQMGALFLCVEDFDITVRETDAFSELVSKANNFEIYPVGDETVKLSIMFDHALIRIKN